MELPTDLPYDCLRDQQRWPTDGTQRQKRHRCHRASTAVLRLESGWPESRYLSGSNFAGEAAKIRGRHRFRRDRRGISTVWNSYGVEVTIVEMLPRIVPLEDEEVSANWRRLQKRGSKPWLAQGRSGRGHGYGVKITVSANGETKVLKRNRLSWRSASVLTPRLAWKKPASRFQIAVLLNRRKMATNVRASGGWRRDCKLMLAHVGSAMGMSAPRILPGTKRSPRL